jgi:hypothetical protein
VLADEARVAQKHEEDTDGDEKESETDGRTPREPRAPAAPVLHALPIHFLLLVGHHIPVLMSHVCHV